MSQETTATIDPEMRELLISRRDAGMQMDHAHAPFPMTGQAARRYLLGGQAALEWAIALLDLEDLGQPEPRNVATMTAEQAERIDQEAKTAHAAARSADGKPGALPGHLSIDPALDRCWMLGVAEKLQWVSEMLG